MVRIDIQIDAACTEPRIVIHTDRMTEEISTVLEKLEAPRILMGFRDGQATVIDPARILRAYAAGGKVYVSTAEGEYAVRLRLYELENRLDRSRFVRISHSEIINLGKVRGFDLSLAGTIRVTLEDGTAAWVSRRYVPKIRQVLGI